MFKLINLTGDNVTIKKIVVGGEESSYSDLVPSNGERMVYLADSNTNCVCGANQKNAVCVVEIIYETRQGLEKKETRNLTIDCVNSTSPSQPLQVSGLGSGTPENPFVINSCKELQRMNQHLDWHYILGGDINCYDDTREGGALYNDGKGFEPIGRNGVDVNFTGNFDGKGHTISDLVINEKTQNVGLFGTSTGNISNVGVVNVLINSSGWNDIYIGGLIGSKSAGSISNSYWDIVLSGKSSCYKDGNTGCSSISGDGSDYFGSNGIPFTELGFDGNWVARDNNYPIFAWQ